QLTYLLTIPPYGFYWFLLSADTQQPAWSTATSGSLVEYHTFVLRQDVEEIIESSSRTVLQNEVLPLYVPPRRWFQSKDKKITSIRVQVAGRLPGADNMLYGEIDVQAGDSSVRYTLPMSIAWEGMPTAPFEVPLALARVRKGRSVGYLTDAF